MMDHLVSWGKRGWPTFSHNKVQQDLAPPCGGQVSTSGSFMLITSPHNPRIGKLRDLHTPRGRKKSGLFLMEGPHLLEALLQATILPQEVYYQPELLQRTTAGRTLLAQLLHTPGLAAEQLI